MVRSLSRGQAIGLAALLVACTLVIAQACSAETLQCWPAHAPTGIRADAGLDPDAALFGLIVSLAACAFIFLSTIGGAFYL